jgi:hypothetical protein
LDTGITVRVQSCVVAASGALLYLYILVFPNYNRLTPPAHPTKLLLIGQSHLLFTLLTFSIFINNRSLFSSFGFDPRLATHSPNGGAQPIVIGFLLFQLVLEPLDSLVKVLMNAMTRKYEYQAGKFVARGRIVG